MIDLPQILTLALPVAAMLASYIIQRNHYSAPANTAIAITTIGVAATASVFAQGHLTNNIYGDVSYVIAAGIALQAGTFAPLQQYLKDIPNNTTTSPVIPSSVPQPITLASKGRMTPPTTPEHGG